MDITNREQASHVLLTFADFQRLCGNQTTIIELLAQPPGVEAIDFHPPKAPDTPQPADLE
ncbi:hypothetical protein [Candidatus Poriferisocius sp.]|uniref:hypothetical protein n=1 Tax=Candidatus Poriferisocius sp. TaxID=3101276 RepID=UPI003B015B63